MGRLFRWLAASAASLALALCVCPLLASANEVDAQAEGSSLQTAAADIATGTWGTCPWTIDAAGTLTVHAGTGEDTNYTSPWNAYFGSIKKIVITEKVVAPANCSCLLGAYFPYNTATSMNLSGLDTSNVTNMSSMFAGCTSLTSLDLSGFDTSGVTRMFNMFAFCEKLTTLNVSSFDTPEVTDTSGMFSGCAALTSLDISNFDTQNVSSMQTMFAGCSALSSLKITGLDTSNVGNMEDMFSRCSSLTSLDVSSFDTSKVTDMGEMFYQCSALTSLDLSSFDTSKVEEMGAMFVSCSSLVSLNLSSFDTSNVASMGGGMGAQGAAEGMFYGCSKLATVSIGSKFSFKGSGAMGDYILAQLPAAHNSDGRWLSATTGAWYTSAQIASNRNDIADIYGASANDLVTNSLTYATITPSGMTRDMTGSALAPSLKVVIAGKTLVEGTDYQVSYTGTASTSYGPTTSAPSAAGFYTVKVEALGKYVDEKTVGTLAIYDATGAVKEGVAYRLHSAADSAFVLDVAGAVPKLGANVSVWTSNGGKNQCFTFEADDNGCYVLRNVADATLVLDAAGNPAKSGSNVSTWTENGGDNQKWALVPNSDGTYSLASASGISLVLDAAGAKPQIGANVSLYTSNGGANQRWTIEDASDIAGATVKLSGNARNFNPASTFKDVEPLVAASFGAAGVLVEGTDFQVTFRGADGTTHQPSETVPAAGSYTVVATGTGSYHGTVDAGTLTINDVSSAIAAGTSYRVRSAASTASDPYILDVASNVPVIGANVSIWTANGGANQCFTFELGVDGCYVVRNYANTALVLDAAGYPPHLGSNVSTWSENGFGNQKWVVMPNDDGTYTMATAYDTSLVLDAAGATPTIGANVSAWTSNGGKNQRWYLEDGGVDIAGAKVTAIGMVRNVTSMSGSTLSPTITAVQNGRALVQGTDYTVSYEGIDGTSYGPSTAVPDSAGSYAVTIVGTGTEVSGFYGTQAVGTFALYLRTAMEGEVYRLHSLADDTFVLDVAGAVPHLGSNVSIWTDNGGKNQCFTLEPDGNGYFVLRNVADTSLVLDAAGSAPVLGANVSTWTENGGVNQKWVFIPNDDGSVTIASAANPSFVLDAAGAKPTIGANVSVWTSNGGMNQCWMLVPVDPATLGTTSAAADVPVPDAGSVSGSATGSSAVSGSGSATGSASGSASGSGSAIGSGSASGSSSGSAAGSVSGSQAGSASGRASGSTSGTAPVAAPTEEAAA